MMHIGLRIQLLIWFLCTNLLKRNHGFTPPSYRSARIRQQVTIWNGNPTGNNSWGSDGAGGGNNNKNKQRNSHDGSGADGPDRNGGLPYMIGGGAAWLWTYLWDAKQSSVSPSSSQIALAGSSIAAPVISRKRADGKMLLVAGIVFLQTIGRQVTKIVALAARQGTSWYLTRLNASPLLTKSVTSGLIGIVGDYAAQWFELRLGRRNRKSSNWLTIHGTYDARRGLAILVDGLFISGPIMHWGYNLFEHVLPVAEGRSFAAIAHVIADSIVLDSIFVGTALVATGLMEGYKFRRDICPRLQQDYADTLKASWATSTTLLPVGFVCFRYLPVTLRTLAMNLTDVLWNGVISFMAHRHRVKSM